MMPSSCEHFPIAAYAAFLKPSGLVAKSKGGDPRDGVVLRDSMASSLARSTLLDRLAPDDERAPFA
jgi:hypothetical protein